MTEKPKRNKRKMKKSFHIGGTVKSNSDVPATIHSSTNPYEISDEEVRQKRAIRENREDIQAAFGLGY